MSGWAFYAYGTPAPQGSKRHVGHGVMVESSAKVRPWREAVKAAGEGAGPTLDGPLAALIVFTLPRPKTAKKTYTIPDRTPDLSKLVRATEDAITDIGLWADDARIASCHALKVFAGYHTWALPHPGVIVAASTLPADSPQTLDDLVDHQAARARLASKAAS
jgi:crossover junction endodeoxyribonuclease RusA